MFGRAKALEDQIRFMREVHARELQVHTEGCRAQVDAVRMAWNAETEALKARIAQLEKSEEDYRDRFMLAIDQLLLRDGKVGRVTPIPKTDRQEREMTEKLVEKFDELIPVPVLD